MHLSSIGEVRTKPGRGDPTQSLSCSDKIAKWCVVGFQGSLLSAFFVQPLIPKAIIIGSPQADEESLARAFFTRFGFTKNVELWTTNTTSGDKIKSRENKECNGEDFDDKEFSVKGQLACDASIFWNKNQVHGVIVDGRKQGCIKKHFGTPKAESVLCRKLSI